ncbi:SEL1-like repeat protein [Asticcacaulis sp. BYS171W]|uniref:SEL1-like repeat protein n=1 Tax=Asticcacaulis aquaticus TaxID=2984212 RepID=A0ABT5HU34_9CAUL|nr:SEL1-like repeat protein [Asticcacaulis aquaticus]MDC7683583.1 SEL1-like repeat protein [Asticcacaulis aquaticus]
MFRKMLGTVCALSCFMALPVLAQTKDAPAKSTDDDKDVTEVTVLLKKERAAPIFDANRPLKSFFTSSDGCGWYDNPAWEFQDWAPDKPRPMTAFEKAYVYDFTGKSRFDEKTIGATTDGQTTQDSGSAEEGMTFGGGVIPPSDEDAPLTPCEQARYQIARRDKSLSEAFAFYEQKQYPEARARFETAYGKVGYDIAGLMLGDMYRKGQGVPRDMAKAIGWYRKVAEKAIHQQEPFDPKNPTAMSPRAEAAMMLAQIYLAGDGVPRDFKNGLRYVEQASAIGYVPATKLAGDFYYKGIGAPRNLKKAVKNYETAALLGYAPAQYAWAEILYDGEGEVRADPAKARELYALAARGGNAGAQYQMAVFYDTGDGVKADAKTALIYYKDAALGGDADAQNAIGSWFYQGDALLPKDQVVARKWFETAAQTGHSEAAFNLAVMYAKGEGGAKDAVKAWLWFDVARRAGHPNAAVAGKQIEAQMTEVEKAELAKIIAPKT